MRQPVADSPAERPERDGHQYCRLRRSAAGVCEEAFADPLAVDQQAVAGAR
jgi:hypothetical protein